MTPEVVNSLVAHLREHKGEQLRITVSLMNGNKFTGELTEVETGFIAVEDTAEEGEVEFIPLFSIASYSVRGSNPH